MNNTPEFRNSIIVSPPSQYLNLTAGETYHGSISVANPASATETMEFFVSLAPYSVQDNNYSADFSTSSLYNDIVEWITIDNDHGSLEPNEDVDINFTINVPKDAHAGGQYCALAVRNSKNNENTLVHEFIEIASIIYARIDGEITESGEIKSHNIPSIVFTPPIKTTYSFENSGNVHLNATLKTTITNFFTNEKVYNDADGKYITETIMPNSTRIANYTYNTSELGLFKLTQTVSYNGESLNVEKTIFVCPIWFFLLVSSTIIFIIVVIILRIKKSIIKRKSRPDYNAL